MKLEIGRRYTFQVTAGSMIETLIGYKVVRIEGDTVWVQADEESQIIPIDKPAEATPEE